MNSKILSSEVNDIMVPVASTFKDLHEYLYLLSNLHLEGPSSSQLASSAQTHIAACVCGSCKSVALLPNKGGESDSVCKKQQYTTYPARDHKPVPCTLDFDVKPLHHKSYTSYISKFYACQLYKLIASSHRWVGLNVGCALDNWVHLAWMNSVQICAGGHWIVAAAGCPQIRG